MLRVRKLIVPVLAAAMLLSGCGGASVTAKIIPDGETLSDIKEVSAPDNETLGNYKLAAKNDNFSLFFEDNGLTVAIRDNKTGHITQSAAKPDEDSSETWKNFVNSGIVIEYFKGSAATLSKLNMYSGSPERDIKFIENGIAAKINFNTVGISFTVFITLSDTGISVKIPNNSINESNKEFKLAAIYALPFLGFTHGGDTPGYMLIPDGCGALIELKDNNEKYSQPYKAKVYGGNYSVEENSAAVQMFEDSIATKSDTASVSAPVFGMVHTSEKSGFLGIIEEGRYNAEIYAYPNGAVTDYNWITPRYIYRETYLYPTSKIGGINAVQEKRETFDISVRYDFVNGDNAGWQGLAKVYRKYLYENGTLDKNTNDEYSLRLDFFSGDIGKSLFGSKYVSMTTIDEMEEITDDLINSGTDDFIGVYKGWQNGGIFGTLPDSIKFSSAAGALSQFNKLNEKYNGSVKLLLYADFLNTYTKKGSSDYIYRLNGRVFSNETFLEMHPQKYRYNSLFAAKLIENYSSSGAGIAADGVTDEAYSYSVNDGREMYSRKQFSDDIKKALETAASKTDVAYYSPNDYLWSSTKSYFDFKLYGSDYKFVSEEVPFLSMVLKGSMSLYGEYVNFKADSTEYFLKMIESGVYPSFLLTYRSPSELLYTDSSSLFSSEYSEYKKMITEYYKSFSEFYKCTKGANIENYSKENGVSVTEYSNGTAVYVNFGDKPVTENGTEIAAHSYCLKAGDGV